MRTLVAVLLTLVSVAAAAATLFFGYYGIRLVHFALTYRGEGSLGHVGAYIAAGLFPLLALVCGAVAWSAGRAARRRWRCASRSGGSGG